MLVFWERNGHTSTPRTTHKSSVTESCHCWMGPATVLRTGARHSPHTIANRTIRPFANGMSHLFLWHLGCQMPYVWIGIIVSVSWHELGHALALGCEGLSITGAGVFIAVCLPGAYVRISDEVRMFACCVSVAVEGPI